VDVLAGCARRVDVATARLIPAPVSQSMSATTPRLTGTPSRAHNVS